MLENFDTIICIGTATISGFIACLLIRLRPVLNPSRYLIHIYFGVSVFALYAILEALGLSPLQMFPLYVYCGLLPLFVFLFVQDVMQDRPFDKPLLIGAFTISVAALSAHYYLLVFPNAITPVLDALLGTMKALLLLASLWLLTSNWKNDLINLRVEFRIKLIITSIIFGLFILGVEALQNFVPFQSGIDTKVNYSLHAAMLIAVFWSGIKMLTLERSIALVISGEAQTRDTGESKKSFDADKAEQLQRLISEEEVFRVNGLSVSDLATRMGIKEYQLRNLINRTLGHRNFTDFLNEYRLSFVKKQLVETDLPILSIALDAGYKSISPFNRAFKNKFGITPSQYRLQAPAHDKADTE